MVEFTEPKVYLHLLEDWKVRYAPKTPDDVLDDRRRSGRTCYRDYYNLDVIISVD